MIELQYDSCLVTGGAGFIGSHICEEALAQGKRVVCLDNLVAGKMENIEPFMENENFQFVEADVSELEDFVDVFDGVDVVFHNAASKNNICLEEPRTDLLVNAWGAFSVADAARRKGVKKVVHASTGSVYGEMVIRPQNEEHPTRPANYYGVSKLAGESYLHAFKAYYPEFRFSVIRYFHVYGARQDHTDQGGVIPIFIRRAYHDQPLIIYGDGSQLRSFTYVKDDVAANFLLANSDSADSRAHNAASGIKVTILELAQAVLRLMKKEHLEIQFQDWRPGDIKIFDVDNSRIKGLGARFETPFEEGLSKTIRWYCDYFDRVGAAQPAGQAPAPPTVSPR